MTALARRTFLQQAGVATAVAAAGIHEVQANDDHRTVVAVIGTGGMGSYHVRSLAARSDIEFASVCDVDQNRLAAAAKLVTDAGRPVPKMERDLRKVLDDKRVEAVWIATPDHWHTPAALLALDAGKHVYVEKPCCHNIREGRLLSDAVKRTGRVLQVGTQSRSTPTVMAGIQRILNGDIGEVLVAKAWNSQRRGSIGRSQPGTPPAYLDYDLWSGPAPMVPYRPNLLPGVWRWWYDFGCGDIGNDGVHDLDVACWGLGVETHPSTVSCLGGKYFFDDDQQFPDTQYAVFEYPQPNGRARQLIFEQRIWSPYTQEGYENGAAFYGTNGLLIMGHTSGWKLYGPRNKLIAEQSGAADLVAHHTNFLDCLRGVQKKPNADVHAGVLSATLVHLANISARVGRTIRFDPASDQILNDEAAQQLVSRRYRENHWATPET